MAANVAISTLDVPDSFCLTSIQSSWPTLVSFIRGQIEGNTQFINSGNTTPAAEDRDKPWFRTNSDGTPDKFYSYVSGSWLALHPIPTGIICLWDGAEAGITTLDGGEAGVISPTTGAFWQKVSQLDARFAIGPGTLPSGTVINVGDTGGEEKHVLSTAELPAHTHGLRIGGGGDTSGGGQFIESVTNADSPQVTVQTLSSGSGDGHLTIPPYRGTFYIKRTARLYYRV